MYRAIKPTLVVAFATLFATSTIAAPADTSCNFADVMGGNNVEGVAELFETTAPHWLEESRVGVTNTVQSLLTQWQFNGGNVYRVAKFGNDVELHFLILRRDAGEVSVMRLTYESNGDELNLTTVNFKQNFVDALDSTLVLTTDAIPCG